MRISGTQTTTARVDVEVRPQAVWEVVRRAILLKYGLQNAEYLREVDGRPVFKADDEHRHGSITESVVIAEPTEEQIRAWKAIKELEAIADFRSIEEHAKWPN